MRLLMKQRLFELFFSLFQAHGSTFQASASDATSEPAGAGLHFCPFLPGFSSAKIPASAFGSNWQELVLTTALFVPAVQS